MFTFKKLTDKKYNCEYCAYSGVMLEVIKDTVFEGMDVEEPRLKCPECCEDWPEDWSKGHKV